MRDQGHKVGTDDLEAGMLPSRARSFLVIAVIAVGLLAVFNARSLVDWARQPQPGPGIAALEKPAAAWTPEQVVDFMLTSMGAGDFYILCPDNDVPREMDERRILWAAGDIVENRPPLSRWHPDYKEAFARFAKA